MLTTLHTQRAAVTMDIPMEDAPEPSNASSPLKSGDEGDDGVVEPSRHSSSPSQYLPPARVDFLVGPDTGKQTAAASHSGAASTEVSDGSSRSAQNEPTRGVKKTTSLRRGAAGYNQLLQAAVMASIEVQKDMGNLDGDDDDDGGGVGGGPSPPPPSPDSIHFAENCHGGSPIPRKGGPVADGGTASSPFGGLSPSGKNKRSRTHHRQDGDDQGNRVPAISRKASGARRSRDDNDGEFDDYEDTTMDLEI